MTIDGFVKSPSAPLGAGLRALSRLWRESFLRNHRFADFLRVHLNLRAQNMLFFRSIPLQEDRRIRFLFFEKWRKKGIHSIMYFFDGTTLFFLPPLPIANPALQSSSIFLAARIAPHLFLLLR